MERRPAGSRTEEGGGDISELRGRDMAESFRERVGCIVGPWRGGIGVVGMKRGGGDGEGWNGRLELGSYDHGTGIGDARGGASVAARPRGRDCGEGSISRFSNCIDY